MDTPPPGTLEGLLYALPDDRYVLNAAGLHAALGDRHPTPREESPYFGYAPLAPAQLPRMAGVVYVSDVPRG